MNMNQILQSINGVLADKILVFALLGIGMWFTVQLKFIQIKGFSDGMRRTFGGLFSRDGAAGKDGMSSFQAFATAIAAQVGTGNLAGAATAIATGGPGAIFWMWVSAFFGMATIYAEALMAQKYKTVGDDGVVTGGPAYYIAAAVKGRTGKVLSIAFSVFITLALGFMGNAVQSNSIADAFNTAFGLNQLLVGIVIAAVCLFVFFGGMKRIASLTQRIVPVMACFYILGSLIVIVINWKYLGAAFGSIFVGAFAPKAVFGGVFGYTIARALSRGVARGLFSNEAGMGSTPHAHAVARVKHPVEQGFVAMVSVFIDTFVILTLTALVILTNHQAAMTQPTAWDLEVANGANSVKHAYSMREDKLPEVEERINDYTGILAYYENGDTSKEIAAGYTGTGLTQAGFKRVYGKAGEVFIALCMLFFAFSTIIGWYFFGEANIKYMFGAKYVKIYALIVAACIVGGSMQKVDLVWTMSDSFNSLMVIPNVIALFILTKGVKELTQDYYENFKGEMKASK